MQYAIVGSSRAVAAPGLRALCPCCKAPVIPKCGALVVHHWAHESLEDCDAWSEGESAWHRGWKERWPESCREVVMGRHRADVRTSRGTIIELQHSHLSVEKIAEREVFYNTAATSLVWLWDVREPVAEGRLSLRPQGEYTNFRWKHARRSIAACLACYWDVGDGRILDVRKVHAKRRDDGSPEPFAGWGYMTTVEAFVAKYTDAVSLLSTQGPSDGGLFA